MTGTTGMRCPRRRWSWSMCAPSRWASPRRRRRRRSRAGRPWPRAVAAVAPGWPRRSPSPTPTSSTARRSAPARGSRGPRSSRCRPRRSWWRLASPSRSIGTARSWWSDDEPHRSRLRLRPRAPAEGDHRGDGTHAAAHDALADPERGARLRHRALRPARRDLGAERIHPDPRLRAPARVSRGHRRLRGRRPPRRRVPAQRRLLRRQPEQRRRGLPPDLRRRPARRVGRHQGPPGRHRRRAGRRLQPARHRGLAGGAAHPPLRVVDRGTLRRDVWRMLFANVRLPIVEEDIRAQIGGTVMGERGVVELYRRSGAERVESHLAHLFDAAERRMRAELARIPDGVYTGESMVFDDGHHEGSRHPIRVTITARGGELSLDYTGTAPQTVGFVNAPLASSYSAVLLTVLMLVDPEIPHNEGILRALRVDIPRGTLLNADFPAATTFGNTLAGPHSDAIFRARADAVPDRGSARWNRKPGMPGAGHDPRRRRRYLGIPLLALQA